ncbi:cyclin-domain-containing protein [Fennellomyces sp. T-0311]|nr:cyclin-domain-containing protein [Fennellomyces sp. T-0311]
MSPCQHGMAFPPSLTLLSCANSSELADFCALVVPCIWAGSFKQPILNAKRYATFKMFCQKVLKATQISCACVLLALYYIHRLRSAYPSIRASIGSEVRLFTTALILANKFLDDNTFTNKTWSDVSSIPVRELNIMEMEFLSALNYNIYIHHQQFFAWVTQCQHWVPLMTEQQQQQQQQQRPIKMPARLSIKSPPPLPMSASMPTILPSTTSSTPSLKRSAEAIEAPAKRRYYHVPYTPPDETISPSYPQTPLYTPPDLRLSLCTSNTPNATPTSASICRPILSWSSSSSALASSRHTQHAYSAASSVATAAAAVAVTTSLASRVQCLEIE